MYRLSPYGSYSTSALNFSYLIFFLSVKVTITDCHMPQALNGFLLKICRIHQRREKKVVFYGVGIAGRAILGKYRLDGGQSNDEGASGNDPTSEIIIIP